MLVASFVRYFKVYRGINFAPVTTGDLFSSYIGENGVGKSSVLEAVDCFFNGANWNINIESKEKGISEREPYICLIFIIEKKNIKTGNRELNEKILALSDYLWGIKLTDFNQSQSKDAEKFITFRERLKSRFPMQDYAIVLSGKDYQSNPRIAIFHTIDKIRNILSSGSKTFEENIIRINSFILRMYTYIYIPAEVDTAKYTKLENKSIQEMMGESINETINKIITDSQIRDINSGLISFVEEIGARLNGYKYKKPARRQKNVTREEINSRVIEAFFENRVLNRVSGVSEIPVKQLSSGEKRKALIDIAHSFLKYNILYDKYIIFAIDEPEASLHASACFDQFEKLVEMADFGVQVITTTHWYGFIPAVTHGVANLTDKSVSGDVRIESIELHEYRESIKRSAKSSNGGFPSDVSLKSINDLVQSIMSSVRRDDPYNWIICEGSSEKIYFEYYFEQEIKNRNLRILPVGGAKSVRRIYQYLELPIEEDKKYIKGKIFCLIDTDSKFLDFQTSSHKNLRARRLFIYNGKVELLKMSDDRVSPTTEIEDCLDPIAFYAALSDLSSGNQDISEILDISSENIPAAQCSSTALNLRPTDKTILDNFLNENDGSRKIELAKKYVEACKLHGAEEPAWVSEIKHYLLEKG